MIEEIAIRDLGVIGETRLPLGPGFTAVTGETGAGKTMVVTALGLLLGARSDAGAVRSGAAQASIDGVWRVPAAGPIADRVRDAGGSLDEIQDDTAGAGRRGRTRVREAELLLGRTVTAEGRSRATVGGRSAPVGVLGELGEQLVVVHGQSEQLRLRSGGAQREALDRFGGAPLADLLERYGAVFRRAREARVELDGLIADRDQRIREAAQLRADLDEIERLAPQRGEDAELAERIGRLSNLEDLRRAATEAQEAVSAQLTEDAADALSRIEQARRSLDRMVAHDPALPPILEGLAAAAVAIADVSGELSHYLATLDEDGSRELETLQERRAELGVLARRFGGDVDAAVDFFETAGLRLIELDGDADRIAALEAQVVTDEEAAAALAAELTAARTAAGERLAAAVTAELAALAMPDARLTVEITDREPGSSGRDAVALLLQPHAGAEPRPLARGASGGELSRVMLAIEVVLAGSDPVPTFVFDEVDAGVGGASAIEIGRRLAKLAETAQVIVVTHLAQVAAFATNHLTVVKGGDGTVTTSSVRRLDGDERLTEMARLLSGLPDSASGLEHARELLANAGRATPRAIR